MVTSCLGIVWCLKYLNHCDWLENCVDFYLIKGKIISYLTNQDFAFHYSFIHASSDCSK